MSFRFDLRPDAQASEIRLMGPGGAIPIDRWALDAPAAFAPGVDLARRLEAAGSAVDVDGALLVNSATLAGLTAVEAARLGLPPLADTAARIEASGLFMQPGYRLTLNWMRPTGQPIVGSERLGPWLKIGAEWRRLPDALYAIAEAVDRVNGAGAKLEDRLAALAELREALPAGAEQGLAEASSLVGSIHVAIADAFSLDLRGERLAPVLHRALGDPEAPLLPPDRQEAFEQRFHSASMPPPVCALSGGWYVVPQPPLRRALAVVKRVNGGSAATRRAFLANPRAFLREEMGDEADAVALESVFRETAAYADRVVGLGLWKKRVLPWIQLPSTDWLHRGAGEAGTPRPPPAGLTIGDRRVPLNAEQARELAQAVERARSIGEPQVQFQGVDGVVAIPATPETLAALAALDRARSPKGDERSRETPAVLLIEPNEINLGIEEDVRPLRPSPALEPPAGLKTALKPHQAEGLLWLQKAWKSGLPGVLLADDMGLGKTLQGLAFLAWLKQGMRAGELRRAPLLVVAPTGLLKNWRAEHDKHHSGEGLGRCCEAFGAGLSGGSERPCRPSRAWRHPRSREPTGC